METGGLCVTVQDRSQEVVYMEIFNDWMPDHKEWNKKTYDRFMNKIRAMSCVRDFLMDIEKSRPKD